MERQPQVVVYPIGAISKEDRDALRDAGIIAIESDNPDAVKQVAMTQPLISTKINGDMVVYAALRAIADCEPQTSVGQITSAGLAAHGFIKNLSNILLHSKGDK